MATKPECHDAVRLFVKSLKPPLKLSLPALETLAVIAYKQPVTAPEVNEIRGVDSSGVFGSLLARKLIATAGRKPVIGRPILYKTTREFLLRFGLKDVTELPSMEEFEKMAASELEEDDASRPEMRRRRKRSRVRPGSERGDGRGGERRGRRKQNNPTGRSGIRRSRGRHRVRRNRGSSPMKKDSKSKRIQGEIAGGQARPKKRTEEHESGDQEQTCGREQRCGREGENAARRRRRRRQKPARQKPSRRKSLRRRAR